MPYRTGTKLFHFFAVSLDQAVKPFRQKSGESRSKSEGRCHRFRAGLGQFGQQLVCPLTLPLSPTAAGYGLHLEQISLQRRNFCGPRRETVNTFLLQVSLQFVLPGQQQQGGRLRPELTANITCSADQVIE
jgi:hypothetical protein